MNERFLCKGSVTVWVKPFTFWEVKFGEWCTGSVRGSLLTLPYSFGNRAVLETRAAVSVQRNLHALIEWVHMAQAQHQISPVPAPTPFWQVEDTGQCSLGDRQTHRHTHTHTHTHTHNANRFDSGNPLQYSCLENPHGQRSLAVYSPWGCKESDMTERLSTAQCRNEALNIEVCVVGWVAV